ncbi:hypothetical protein NDU88_002575 [Pleurodeles waltl]|uniref:Uncharacterized protein n=1 Tax=Pleurodeles waltl TaxID=8319 RepID=A0AAV7QAB1_PLEWA|nr:hypothetical protein NDU88_002575 [Pleurodeles waltl]
MFGVSSEVLTGRMADEEKVQAALGLLRQGGRMDLVRVEALAPGRSARRASTGVTAAVMACSPLRAGSSGIQGDDSGRTFCRRLALALSGQALPHHHVRLQLGVREDLRMWAKFLESFNGIPLRVCRDCEWDLQLFSDAAGLSGLGFIGRGVGVRENGCVNGRMGVAVLRSWSFSR